MPEPYLQKSTGKWVVDVPKLDAAGNEIVNPKTGRHKRERWTLGDNKQDALAEFYRRMYERSSQAVRKEPSAPPADELTLADLATRYVSWLEANRADKTFKTIRGYLRWLITGRGGMPVYAVTPELIEGIVTERSRAGLAPRSCHHFVTAVKLMFNWGVRKKLVDRNPLDKAEIDKPEIGPAEDRSLTEEEIGEVLERTEDRQPEGDLVRLLLLTGARVSEILGLPWSAVERVQVNGGGEIPVLVVEKHKTVRHTKRPKVIPLSKKALEIVERQPKHGEAIFSQDNGRPWLYRAMLDRLKRALTPTEEEREENPGLLDVSWVTFHCFRHTYASQAFSAGHRLGDVGNVLGHASTVMTLHYVKARQAHLQEVSEGLVASLPESVLQEL